MISRTDITFKFTVSLLISAALCSCGGGILNDENKTVEEFRKHYDLGYVHENKKEFKEAEAQYELALQKLKHLSSGYERDRGKALAALATTQFHLKKNEEAQNTTAGALKIYKALWKPDQGGVNNRENALQIVKLLMVRGEIEYQSHDLKKSLDTINSAITISRSVLAPDLVRYRLLTLKARIMEESGDKKGAEAILKDAEFLSVPFHLKEKTELENTNPKNIFEDAKKSFEGMNYLTAEKMIATYLPDLEKKEPDSYLVGESYALLGSSKLTQTDYKAAEKLLEKSINILKVAGDMKNKETKETILLLYDRLAVSKLNLKKKAEAESLVLEGLKLNRRPDNGIMNKKVESRLLTTLTEIQIENGEFKQARETVKQRMDLENQNGNRNFQKALNTLSSIYSKEGDFENACKTYEKAIAIQEMRKKDNPIHLTELIEEYALYLENQGKPEKAHIYKERARSRTESVLK